MEQTWIRLGFRKKKENPESKDPGKSDKVLSVIKISAIVLTIVLIAVVSIKGLNFGLVRDNYDFAEYLNENYTTHLSKTDTDNLMNNLSGKYQGIGIEILEDLTINSVFDPSPALDAGMKKGDKLYKINIHLKIYKTIYKAFHLGIDFF